MIQMGVSAIGFAVENDHSLCLELLLKAGTDPNGGVVGDNKVLFLVLESIPTPSSTFTRHRVEA